ncbi:MAG: hypothetical protein ACJAVK_000058, partial [Akkermansiaceae bacterium]
PRKQLLGSNSSEATPRKQLLGSNSSEATPRKQLLGSNRLELSPNSVSVANGIVAVAIARKNTETGNPVPGLVAFFNTDGEHLVSTRVGFLPDMVTFTPDKRSLVVANEGEPNDDSTFDPEGSVSIIDTRTLFFALRLQDILDFFGFRFEVSFAEPEMRTAHFRRFNLQNLRPGIIGGPGS